jgi:hypothetical protein
MPVDPGGGARDRAKARARAQAVREAARWVRQNHPDVWARIQGETLTANKVRPPGRTPKPREHGTPRGYHQHRRHGETPCAACKKAINDYQKQFPSQQAKRKKGTTPTGSSPWPPPSPFQQFAKVMIDGLNTDPYPGPIPGRLHRCTPYLSGVDDGRLVERCLCGAIRFDGRVWINRNSRRKGS